MDWKAYSYVVRAKTRAKVLKTLDSPKTPKQIADDVKVSVSNISRALSELSSKELVKCLTPKEKTGRVYRRTKKGDEIVRKIN